MAQRSAPRLRCSIEMLACTTIDVRPARIIDVSRVGAKVQLDEPFASGTRIHLDVEGDYYWGTVMWAEVDRMGIRFTTPVTTGALDDRLKQLQVPVPGPGRRGTGFGRRLAG